MTLIMRKQHPPDRIEGRVHSTTAPRRSQNSANFIISTDDFIPNEKSL
jgi:hypothetical protein